jgi:DNA-binding transcriptional ArsR family regulator
MFNISSGASSMRSNAKAKKLTEDRLDLVFRALGDRTRRALLARLAQKPAMVTELAQPFAMSLPAVSRHIRVLERARLVVRKVDGRVHHCALDPAPLKTAEAWLGDYRQFWEGQLAALARFVESDERKKQR